MALKPQFDDLVASLSKVGLGPGSTELIPENFKLTTELVIGFGGRAVSLGNIFRASECKVAPTISFASEEGISGSYTLLLVDPDAPTPEDPKFAYWRHWVLPGLRPSTPHGAQGTDAGLVSQSKAALTEYLGPGPKDESSPHRYLFLLFREPEGYSPSKEDVGGEEFTDRRSFKAAEWVLKHGLQLVSINWMLGVGDGWTE